MMLRGGRGQWRGQVFKNRQAPDFLSPKGEVCRGTGSFLGVVDGSRVQSPNDIFESKEENTLVKKVASVWCP